MRSTPVSGFWPLFRISGFGSVGRVRLGKVKRCSVLGPRGSASVMNRQSFMIDPDDSCR